MVDSPSRAYGLWNFIQMRNKESKIFLYFGEETIIITIDRDNKRKGKDLTGGD